ncbi:MAG TPA: hypothetical protein PKI03_36600 [Pseudomonadota bacterium]|nr:hypothetical protein [Pseudomonadota bacterium]
MSDPAASLGRRESSQARLRPRIERIPAELQAALGRLTEPGGVPPLSAADAPIRITGGGMSEGPARFLTALLSERGIAAEYIPLSEFVAAEPMHAAGETPASPRKGTLVLFSQGLAPNARFPLLPRHRRRARRCLLVTAVVPDADPGAGLSARIAAAAQADGVQVLTLPPASEEGLLLRVIGPAVHCLAAAYLAGVSPKTLQAVPGVYAAAARRAYPSLWPDPPKPAVALVAGGRYMSACFGLRWKLLEGLHLPDPPIWDLLQVAHGPLQSIWTRPQTLLLLQRPDVPHEAPLWRALGEVFRAPQHTLLPLPATQLPGSLAYFEQDAGLNWLVLQTLAAANRGISPSDGESIDLIDWPGRGSDGPLYNLAPDGADLLKLDQGAGFASNHQPDDKPGLETAPESAPESEGSA